MGMKKANWDATLNADKAGAAANAEDFTKQFMAQMYGSGGSPSNAVAPTEPPPPVPGMNKSCT